MVRILASVLLVVLLPLMATAQMYPVQRVQIGPTTFMGLDLRVWNIKSGFDLHDGQLSLGKSRAVPEFGVTIIDPTLFRVRGSISGGFGNSDSVIPTGALKIGNVEFVKDNQTSQQNQKPISIDWNLGSSVRIEAVSLATPSIALRPAFVGTWKRASIIGTSMQGQQKTATEDFSGFFSAVGGEFVYDIGDVQTRALFAVGDKYSWVDLNCGARWKWAAVNFGFIHESVVWNGARMRAYGPYIGLDVAFMGW